MDEQRRSLIATAIITLIILALIIGSILFLVRFFQNRQNQGSNITDQTTALPQASGSANPTASDLNNFINRDESNSADSTTTKLFIGEGFQLRYPNNWGLLTCNNSKNFEFDPTNGADQTGVACDRALKSITVLVGSNPECRGDIINLGPIQAVKSKEITDSDTDYRWCTKTTPTLDITHRVSQSAKRGYTSNDYSSQIEQMISSLTFAQGS